MASLERRFPTQAFGDAESGELVERVREREALRMAVEAAIGGKGSVTVVQAAAGAGKTSLLADVAGVAARLGARVLRARGTELEREVPLSTLRSLFERAFLELDAPERALGLCGAPAPLAAALGLVEPAATSPERLHHAIYWLVADLAVVGPLAIVVDDAQWADAASLGALARVGSRLDDLPVALILARRLEEDANQAEALTALLQTAGAPLVPRPLSAQGVAEVLRARGGHEIDAALGAAARRATGGNPFLVVQLADAIAEAGGLLLPQDLDELMGGVARSLSALLGMRVGRLGRDAVMLTHAVTVLGDDAPLGELAAVSDLGREAVLRAAAALASAGIFASDRVAAFAHPLVRAALDAELRAAERTLMRERAVAVQLAGGASPERIAVHLLRTEPRGDPRSGRVLREAAARACVAARPGQAVRLLHRALGEAGPGGPSPDLVDELILAQLGAGDFAGAVEHLRARLAGRLEPAERALCVRRLGRAVMASRGIPAAVDLLDEELASLEGDGRLLVEAEQAWMLMLHPPLAGRLADPVSRYAGLPGATPGERAMLAVIGVAMSFGLAPARLVAPIIRRAFGEGALLADDGPESPLYAISAYAIVLTDQLELAEVEMTRAFELASARGAQSGVSLALTMRGITRLQLGRLDEAEGDGLTAVAAGSESGGALQALAIAQAVGVVVETLAERGDDAGAQAFLLEHGYQGDLGADPGLRVLISRARAHLAAGRPAEALADARRRQAGFAVHEDVLSHSAPIEALALLALGESAEARAVGEAHLARARAWGTASCVAAALRVTALATGGADGIALAQEAIDLMSTSPALLERARLHVVLGMLYRRHGQRADALTALPTGAHLAHTMGARVLAERARSELVVLGSRPRRLAFSGADSLTASERRVARLAAGGATKREIAQELYLSPRTVESHLSRAYRKLGISGRENLGEALGARPAPA